MTDKRPMKRASTGIAIATDMAVGALRGLVEESLRDGSVRAQIVIPILDRLDRELAVNNASWARVDPMSCPCGGRLVRYFEKRYKTTPATSMWDCLRCESTVKWSASAGVRIVSAPRAISDLLTKTEPYATGTRLRMLSEEMADGEVSKVQIEDAVTGMLELIK